MLTSQTLIVYFMLFLLLEMSDELGWWSQAGAWFDRVCKNHWIWGLQNGFKL